MPIICIAHPGPTCMPGGEDPGMKTRDEDRLDSSYEHMSGGVHTSVHKNACTCRMHGISPIDVVPVKP